MDHLPILLSSLSVSRLFWVTKPTCGTGEAQTRAKTDALQKRGVSEAVATKYFDTTAANIWCGMVHVYISLAETWYRFAVPCWPSSCHGASFRNHFGWKLWTCRFTFQVISNSMGIYWSSHLLSRRSQKSVSAVAYRWHLTSNNEVCNWSTWKDTTSSFWSLQWLFFETLHYAV